MKTILFIILLLSCFVLFSYKKPDLERYLSVSGLNKAFKDYPRLGIASIQTEHFELVKILELNSDPLFYVVRYFPDNQTFLFTHASRNFYWKLNARGDFIGSIGEKVQLHSCGVFFYDNYYVDWALTGDSSKKSYKDKIDATTLSKDVFEDYLNSADVIAYKDRVLRNPDRWYGRCLLKIKNDWIVIERKLPNNDEGFDFFKDPERLTMQGHATKNDKAFNLVDDAIPPFYNWEDSSNPFTICAFTKEKRIKKGFFSYDINNTARENGWEGTGYFNWKIGQDTFKFQAYSYKISRASNYQFNPSMSVIKVDALSQLAFLKVDYCKGDRSSEEIGLYVMRKKGN